MLSDASVINGGWGEWGDFSDCTATCGEGNRTRARDCDNPAPLNGGLDCETETEHGLETVACALPPCNGKTFISSLI